MAVRGRLAEVVDQSLVGRLASQHDPHGAECSGARLASLLRHLAVARSLRLIRDRERSLALPIRSTARCRGIAEARRAGRQWP